MDFQLTIDWILEQPIELVRQQSQPSQKASNPFKKPLSVKQSIETIKQLVVFPLLYKTIFFKKVLIPNCFRFKQRVDYTLIYPDPTHTSNNFSLPSNNMDLETSKLQDHPWWRQIPGCLCWSVWIWTSTCKTKTMQTQSIYNNTLWRHTNQLSALPKEQKNQAKTVPNQWV